MPDFISDITATHEDRRREFKRSAPWPELRWKLIRTAMAFANTPDGGRIIIGVEEDKDRQCRAVGLLPEHLASYASDDLLDAINKYAEPHVRAQLYRVEHQGATYLVLDVDEFEERPVVCRQDGGTPKDLLKGGAVYIRSTGKPETLPVRSEAQMRELIDRAVERGLRRFLRVAQGAGLTVHAEPTDRERFEEERASYLALANQSPRIAEGALTFTIRPVTYRPDRFERPGLAFECAQRYQVGWAGYTSFPFIFRQEQQVEGRAAGSPAEPNGWSWFFRIFQSGQFLSSSGYEDKDGGTAPVEYLSARARRDIPHGLELQGIVNLHALVRLSMMAAEFAARMAAAGIYQEPVELGILLTKTRHRALVSVDVRAPVNQLYIATEERIERWRMVDLEALAGSPDAAIAPLLVEVLEQFSWLDVTVEGVQRIQAYLRHG